MSEQVERRLLDLLGHPTESPYGNPIPGLDELGGAPAGSFLDGVESIVARVASAEGETTGIVRRLGEPVQFEPELLAQLRDAGVVPGATVSLAAAGSYVIVQVDGFGDGLELPNEVASHIYVEA